MKKEFSLADLSGWLSPDEERLLNIYRDANGQTRHALMYRITRQRLIPWFSDDFDAERDARDETYLHEELEQSLRLICPRTLLGSFWHEDPHFIHLLSSAWGSIAPVILGPAERDGQHADALFNAALSLWDTVGDRPLCREPMRFSRRDALVFIETWRETVFSVLFSSDS